MSVSLPITRSYEPSIDENANDITLDVSLHKAAAQGDLALMTHLLDSGTDINGRDRGEGTALQRAILNDESLAVRLLISRGADPSLKGSPESDGTDGDDAVTCAARFYKVASMRELIEGGVPIHTGALYHAICTDFWYRSVPADDIDMLRLLIEETRGDFAGTSRRRAFEWALNFATHEWSLGKVRLVMDELDYDNVPDDEDKQNTLNCALLSTLNQDGMHDGFQNVDGHKDPSVVLEIVTMLVEAGASVNVKEDDEAQTLLHFALKLGHIPPGLVEYLVDHGADVNIRNFLGRTAVFDMLVHPETTEQLIAMFQRAGGDFQVVDNFGYTPLHLVRNMDAARWLLASGANPMKGNKDGWTPLKKARIDDNLKLEEFLLSIGARM